MNDRTGLILRRLALGAIGMLVLPVACIYPEYSFNEPEPGATGGGGAGGSGGSGGGIPGVEDCQNGKDDDGDMLADCADTDCTPVYACVAGPPLGWEGYVSLFDGAEADKPSCPSTFPTPFNGHRNLMTPSHSCTGCSCGTPTGQICDLADMITVSDKNCGFAGQTINSINPPSAWQGECFGPAGLQGGQPCAGGPCNSSVTTAKPTVTGGTCTAQGGMSDQLPEQWGAFGFGCSGALQGGGCGAGSVCQPKAAMPFRSGLCVYKSGENACPVGEFSQQFVYFEKAEDTRACSACECNAPTGATCDATIKIYGDQAVNQCTMEIASFNAGGCANLVSNPAVFGRAATIVGPTGGTCGVKGAGGQATGALTPVNPTTFCCIP